MRNGSFLFLGTILAAAGLLIGAPGCSDDGETGGSGGSTSATSTTVGTTTTADTTTTTSGTGGGGGGGAAEPTCEAYCTAIMGACTGENQQYKDEASCLGACGAFDIGTADDTSGNTVGCRLYHAGAAAGDAALHCTHAGPGGNGACGANCEGFCTIALAACTGDNEQYADEAACMAECNAFDATEPYDVTDTAGDTFACRLYHLTVAATDANSAMVHCAHIVEASPVCM
jgi:hypothetical protein